MALPHAGASGVGGMRQGNIVVVGGKIVCMKGI